MSQNDFGMNTEAWGEVNGVLKTALDAIKDFADEMRNIVKQSLLQGGLNGDVAEQLAETYDIQVLSSYRTLENKFDEFIGQNEANKSLGEDMNDASMRVAQSININNIKA